MTEQVRRATRLVRIENLLRQRTWMTAKQLAAETGYSQRTIQRDLGALESELGVPLVLEGRKYGIMAGSDHPLSPVRFTLQEARAVYLAARLFARHADDRDPDGIAALEKIGDTLPPNLAAQVRHSIQEMKSRPANPTEVGVLRTITNGWAESRTVTITYRSAQALTPRTTDLDPYLLEPSASGAATYIIGHSSEHNSVRIFKLDRVQSATLTEHTFIADSLDDVRQHLRQSWGGAVFGDEQFDVAVAFTREVAQRIRETNWHPSQELEELPNGGVVLRLVLPSLLEFVPWVLGWGASAKALTPPSLVEQVSTAVRASAAQY
jgi:predicted DNA-binding transcriptional regulator YafY